jgi:hypothetical protein
MGYIESALFERWMLINRNKHKDNGPRIVDNDLFRSHGISSTLYIVRDPD